MISIEMTEQGAAANLLFLKRAVASIPFNDPDYDGVIDAYVAIRSQFRAATPVKPAKPVKAPAK